jgi:hypothetical protein
MDKVGSDTIKHRTNVIANAAALIRKYQKTKVGDGKMNMHITTCLTTRANGEQRWWWIVVRADCCVFCAASC